MGDYVERVKVRFASGDAECVAWHYLGTNGACVVMAGGGAVTKEPGTDLFAKRFNEAGFSVLAFDYRRLGGSGGRPRQVEDLEADGEPRHGRPGPREHGAQPEPPEGRVLAQRRDIGEKSHAD